MYWTKEVGEAISQEGFKGLTKYGEKCTAELNKIVSLVRGQLTSLERATCGALVTIDVHARDITVQVCNLLCNLAGMICTYVVLSAGPQALATARFL